MGQATVELILRSFETEDLESYATQLRTLADKIVEQSAKPDGYPGLQADVQIRRQYRNLREGLADLPEAVSLAKQAYLNLGRPCTEAIIRGGTDGSQLTEKGLPTPNLSSGQYNIHSTSEFACLDEMVEAVEHLVELLSLWSQMKS